MADQRDDRYEVFMKEVSKELAIEHAIDEADKCARNRHWCAGLAMLRKAIDLWSQLQSEGQNITFNRAKGENDNLFWRLEKIAERNQMYKDSIHTVMHGLRISGNEVMHDSVSCDVGNVGMEFPAAFQARQEPYLRLQTLVVNLVMATRKP